MHSKVIFPNGTPCLSEPGLGLRSFVCKLSPVSEVHTSLGLPLPPQQSELWAKEGLGTQIRLECRLAGTSTRQER